MKKTSQGARYIAIEILCGWEANRLPIDQLMEQSISNMNLADPRDRQLIMSLVYGVLRWRGYLDWVVEKFSKHPLSKMKSRTLQALRVGIFQLLFLDRVPISAAINETVQAFKDMGQPKWLTGFVNGLLRTVSRQQETIPDPHDTKKAGSLPESARLSHPDWLIKRWLKRYGREVTESICQQNNLPASLSLRTNTSLISREALLERLRQANIRAEAGKFGPDAICLAGYQGPITNIPGYTDGVFQVQDEAAQLIALLLSPLQPGKSYLDGCAGLGGKTSHLAQLLPDNSQLFAAEPHIGRIKKLKENLARLRLGKPVTIVEDEVAVLLPDMKEKFDGILIDAPCSGLGVIRRHPDIRWNRKPADLLRYQATQLSLLASAAKLLAPGGILVYATCSTEPEENDEVIDSFLTNNHELQVLNCNDTLPETASMLVDQNGFFRTLPGQHYMDGFFAAKLIKK
jgi:16S rRNA (cytosine967-C5)-methyltransferase